MQYIIPVLVVTCLSPLSADFVNELRSIRKRFDPSSPTVVHCSAGVGRSGVVVLTEMLMDKIDIGEVFTCMDTELFIL